MNWNKLHAIKKRQAVLDALIAHPDSTAAEMRELLGLTDTDNCLSVTMTVMRKRGEIDHHIHPGKIGRHGYARWFALVTKTTPQKNRNAPRKKEEFVRPVLGRLCDPPYGALPYERPVRVE